MSPGARRVLAALALLPALLSAAEPAPGPAILSVYVDGSRLVRTDGLKRVAVSAPTVARPVVVSPSEVMVQGLAPGRTSLYLWDASGRTELLVLVRGFVEDLEAEVARMIDVPTLRVRLVDRGHGKHLFLRGHVPSEKHRAEARAIAGAFVGSGGRVVELLEVRPEP